MPSLIDFANFDPNEYYRRTGRNNALVQLSEGLLAAGRPSPAPTSFAQALGQGVSGFNRGMQDAEGQTIQRYMLAMQMQMAEREKAAEARRQQSMEILRGGPPAVVNESPEGERTAAFNPRDPAYMGAAWDIAPQQMAEQMFKQPPLSPYDQARQTAMGKASAGPQDRGPFQGTGMDQQATNILLRGDPASAEYAAAFSHMSQPRTTFDAATGQAVTTRPDVSAFRPPVRANAATTAPAPTSPPVVTITPVATPKMTEGERLSATYADRMKEAEFSLREFEDAGLSATGRFFEGVPFGNYGQTAEYQQFEQARRNFINAQLRRESGAVISPDEFKNADRQYFPVPGDGKEVLAQKARNRATAIEGMARSAGAGYAATKNVETVPDKYGDYTKEDIEHTLKAQGWTWPQLKAFIDKRQGGK